ncbi:MAG: phytoene/squalene synthase family protein, partial [Hyphomicrobium sp.]
HCDDVIDDQELGFARGGAPPSQADREANLDALDHMTRDALAGRAADPVFVALQRVVQRHDIPAIHPMELIEGFRMDVEGRRHESLDDTLAYCYHVAGVVGVMMAMIMGARGTDALNRAADLGIAFQLTNIARDVVADAATGRIYLPADWIAEAGLSDTDFTDDRHRAALFGVVARLLDIADTYYASAARGIRYLPFRSAWAVASARNVYRDIGGVVRRGGATAWDTRARVGAAGKLAGVTRGLVRAMLSGITREPEDTSRHGLWTHPGLGQGREQRRDQVSR